MVLYTLVYGTMPFDGTNFKKLRTQISSGDYYEPSNPSGNKGPMTLCQIDTSNATVSIFSII